MIDPHTAADEFLAKVQMIEGVTVRAHPATGRIITKSVNSNLGKSAYLDVHATRADGKRFRWDVRISDHPGFASAQISVMPDRIDDALAHIAALLSTEAH